VLQERLLQNLMESGWDETRLLELLLDYQHAPTDRIVTECPDTSELAQEVRAQVGAWAGTLGVIRERLIAVAQAGARRE
jgi:hypothetical protein